MGLRRKKRAGRGRGPGTWCVAADAKTTRGERFISPTIEKGNQFFARALSAQGEGNRRQAVDGIEAEQDIIVLEEGSKNKARQQSVCSS